MSTTIDQKVVEMRFDNKNFESNVSTSMSTLDKLKQKLNLTGASKGLENVSSAASKVNMSGLGSAVDTVKTRFSALEVMGVTALANISNQAVNAGKRLLASFTIDPVKTGFNEYELKMGAVQTIMAGTGESLETVNKYLEELNAYSDKTIYSFSDMTKNIGQFTNAGVKLEDAVLAIKGISNSAALSGANAEKASHAMYNFAQSLSAGYVKLTDWKSIEIANMATVGFKEELIKTAVELGTVTEAADGMYETLDGNAFNATKNFNEVLKDQWMTSDVLVKTLSKYSDETTEIGKKASQAATEVKTFSMMMDTLKEAAQSGWAQTWEIIFGDFNEGKKLWTNLSNFFGGVIDKMSKARNNFLKGGLDSSWDQLIDKVNEAGIETEHFQNGLIEVARKHGIAIDDMIKKEGSFIATLKSGWLTSDIVIETLEHFAGGSAKTAESTEDMTSALEKWQKVVDEVWYGKYKNAPDRQKLLTDAGYDYAVVQALVNKTEGKRKLTMQDLIETQGALSDAQLKNMGYTDEQIKAIRKLADEAKKSGTPINELINNMNRKSGRELLLESFARIGKSCVKIFKALGQAWKEVFPPATSAQLYDAIAGFNKLSEHLAMSDDTADKLKRTFKGMFAALDIVLKLVMGPFKIAFKLLAAILKALDIPILDFTASIGDAIVAVNDWLDRIINFDKAAEFIIKFFNKSKEALFDWIKALKKSDNIPRDIILGIVKGIGKFLHLVVDSMKSLGKTMLKTIKEILGIHSPSKEFFQVAWDCIEGLINGFKAGLSAVWKVIKKLGSGLVNILKKINFGQIIAAGIGVGAIVAAFKLINVFEALTSPLESLGDLFEGLGAAAKGLRTKFMGEGLLDMAKAIGIIALSIIALGIAFRYLDPKDMWQALGMIAALIGALTLFSVLMTKLSTLGATTISAGKGGISVNKKGFGSVIAQIGLTVLFIAIAVKLLAGLKPEAAKQAFISAGIIIGAMLVFLSVLALVGKFGSFADVNKAGTMLIRLSFALMGFVLVAHLAKSLSSLSKGEIIAASVFAGAVLVLCGVITGLARSSTKSTWQAGLVLLALAWTLGQMVNVAKSAAQIGNMKPREMVAVGAFAGAVVIILGILKGFAKKESGWIMKAGITLAALAGALLMLAYASKILATVKFFPVVGAAILFAGLTGLMYLVGKHARGMDKNLDKLASLAIKLSIAVLLLTGIAFLLSLIPWKEALVGVGGVTALLVGIALVLWAASAINPKTAEQLPKTLTKLVIAIGLLAALVIAFTFMDEDKLWEAIRMVGLIVGMLAALIFVTKYAKTTKGIVGTLWSLVGAIAVLAVIVAALSFINADKAFDSLGALTILVIEFVVFIFALNKFGKLSKTARTNALYMLGIVAALSAVVIALSFINAGKALASTGVLAVLMAEFLVFMVLLNKFGKLTKTAKTNTTYMLGIVAALSAVVFMLGLTDGNDALKSVIALGILMGEMLGFMVLVNMVGALSAQAKTNIIFMIGVVAALSVIVGLLSMIDATSALMSVAALGILMVSIAAFMIALNMISQSAMNLSTMVPVLISVAITLGVLAGAIAILSNLPMEQVTSSMLVLAAGLLAITAAVILMNGSAGGATALLAVSAAIAVLAVSLALLASLDIAALWSAVGAIAALLVVLVGLAVLVAVFPPLAAGLLVLGAAVALLGAGFLLAGGGAILFATALTMMASIDLVSMGFGMLSLAAAFALLGAAGLLLIPTAAAVTLLSVAMIALGVGLALTVATIPIFVAAMTALSTINLAGVSVSILALSAAFLVLAAAGLLLIPAAVALTVLSAAVLVLGAGLLLAGSGATIFASAMSILVSLNISGVASSLLALSAATIAFSVAALLMIPAAACVLVMSAALTALGVALVVLGAGLAVAGAAVMVFVAAIKALTGVNLSSVASGIVKKFASGIKSFAKNVTKVGKDLVNGLIKGIKSMFGKVGSVAKSLGKKAVSGIKKFLGIKSPSRVFAQIGKFSGEGLVKGLNGMANSVSKTSAGLGKTAATSMTNAVSRIADAINTDIDSQPTIRPVLDLSDVKSGAKSIGGMFPGRTISVNTRTVGSVAASMAGYQNGNNNDEIVSNIKALHKDFADMPRNSYNINGITYDDGSNVASAVETLVRAARIERRT